MNNEYFANNIQNYEYILKFCQIIHQLWLSLEFQESRIVNTTSFPRPTKNGAQHSRESAADLAAFKWRCPRRNSRLTQSAGFTLPPSRVREAFYVTPPPLPPILILQNMSLRSWFRALTDGSCSSISSLLFHRQFESFYGLVLILLSALSLRLGTRSHFTLRSEARARRAEGRTLRQTRRETVSTE